MFSYHCFEPIRTASGRALFVNTAGFGNTTQERAQGPEHANFKPHTEGGEIRRPEMRFMKNEMSFQYFFRKAPFAAVLLNMEGTAVDVNDRFVRLSGYRLSDIADGKPWPMKIFPDATLRRSLEEMWKEDISRLRSDATERKRIFPFRSADGRTLFIEFSICVLDGLEGYVLLGLNDITERRNFERDLQIRVAERTRKLRAINRRLRQASMEDTLTKLASRRCFNIVLDREIRRAQRSGGYLSLIMADIDFFKQYNDCYGHLRGDECLRKMGQVFRTVFRRAGDLPARFGGEEFCVILPGTGREDAMRLAETLRRSVVKLAVPHRESGVSPVVTISLGVTTAFFPFPAPEEFIDRADQALYKAKADGRNRVSFRDSHASTSAHDHSTREPGPRHTS